MNKTEGAKRIYTKLVLREKKGKQPCLYIRITIDRQPRFISLAKYLPSTEAWDPATCTVKKSFNNSKNLNAFLRRELSKIDQIILELENEGKDVSFESIKEKYKYPVVDFIEFARKEIELLKGKQSEKKLREDTYILNKLERYQGKVNINSITLDWLNRYEHYLRNELGNGDNTVASNLKCLRTYLNRAIQKGITKNYPFVKYDVGFVDGEREFLEINELNTLYNLWESRLLEQHKDKDLQNVLRYSLFPCYAAGLRFTDVKKLTHDKIQGNELRVRSRKTKKIVFVPLVKKALSLLPSPERGNPYVFKTLSNKITNKKLKVIINDIAGIDKKITFHCFRHTFATISLEIGLSLEMVQELLDHEDIKTTKIYAKLKDRMKKKEMEKWEMI